ncbi:MAG: YIP1 family protein [Alphaproteobacteria bacterium]|nr:YIP1 family protein [Alphaproteobacteria bacterium]
MTEINTGPGGSSPLVERAKAILLKPKDEWPKIAAEAATPRDLIVRYAVPLAAIGPVASLLRGQLFGYGMFGIHWKPGLVQGLTGAIVQYVLGLVGIIVLALIADWLAPKFGGTANRTAAFKLVVYGSTAAWLAAIFQLVPGLGILGLAGLYSLYLYYCGAAPVMKVPQDKAASYTAVTVVCAIVLYMVVGAVSGRFLGMTGGSPSPYSAAESGAVSGSLAVPGVGSVDLGKAQQAANDMAAATNNQKPAVDPARLQALLPAAIGSYQRDSLEANALGGIGSEAEGRYTSGDNSFRLKITDMSAMGALAGIGAAMGVQHSQQDANGYEKTGTVNGAIQTEKWRNDSNSGKFSTVVGNRFMVEASGSAASIDELKAAVAQISPAALAALAN